jgi:hypothetical protein
MLFAVNSTSRIFSPPKVSLDLRFMQQQLKLGGGGGLGFVYIISLFTFESSIAFLPYYSLFKYKCIFFPCKKQ